jgi:drug/metabolite transporter (DMT)-like permease
MNNTSRGILLMSTSTIAFSAMACFVKMVSSNNVYLTTSMRFVVGIIIVICFVSAGCLKVSFNNKKSLFFRGLYGGIAIVISFISITKLGLVKAAVLSNTYPIFATIFGVVLLKEKISVVKIAAIAVAFTGIFFTSTNKSSAHGIAFTIGGYELLSVAGAMLGGYAVILVKKLRATESSSSIFLAQCVVGFMLVLIPSFSSGKVTGVSLIAVIFMIGAGIFATAGQLLLTEGYHYVTIGTGAVFAMLGPVLNFVFGLLFFNETLTSAGAVGAIITLLACAVLILPERFFSALGVPAAVVKPLW